MSAERLPANGDHKDTKDTKDDKDKANEVSNLVIGAAIEVHRLVGPGLLESAYEECLAHELKLQGLKIVRSCRSRSSTRGWPWDARIVSICWSRTWSWSRSRPWNDSIPSTPRRC